MLKGEQFARWNNAKGLCILSWSPPAVTVNYGSCSSPARSLQNTVMGLGLVREVSTGCRDETASRSILADLEGRAVRVKAKILTPAEDADD